MKGWRTHGLLLVLLAATSTGCCYDYGSGFIGPHRGFARLGPVLEPACGIATACEPDCGIAGYVEPACVEPACVEPACGIAGFVEPACIEPDCGIVQPACGGCGVFGGGCGGGCGGGYGGYGWGHGYGLFGLFNGWGPDWEVMAAGWNPCLGPCEAIAGAFRCGLGGWGWGGWGWPGWGYPRAGCGSCYWDEWISDPPRCCDPCPDLCASSGCGGAACGGGCGGACAGGACGGVGYGGGGHYGMKPRPRRGAYAQNFHPWPRKPTNSAGGARQLTTASRAQVRSPLKRVCNCAKCQTQRNVARRQMNSGARQVNYQR